MEPVQNPLFKEPIGQIFQSKRAQLGLSPDDVGRTLKFGTHLVLAIEAEQWDKLGPPVYAKSYVNSYIKLLSLPEEIKNEIPGFGLIPALKPIVVTRIESSKNYAKWVLAATSIIVVIALGLFMAGRADQAEDSAIDTVALPAAVNPIPEQVPASASTTITAAAVSPNTVTATTSVASPIANTASGLKIQAKAQSWVEIRDAAGAVVFSELIPAGQERTHSLDKVGRITMGNASQVAVSINGTVQDLSPFIKNEVAKFSIDANGHAIASAQ